MENALMQYGILGVITIALSRLMYQQYQGLIEKNKELEKRIDDLQLELREYLMHDREESNKIMERNTIAFENLMHTLNELKK
jgi:hypothetical protein